MDQSPRLAERFGENRVHLRAVACRMLGPEAEAHDAVQESWLRLSLAGASGVHNLRAWLTTVVARECLDMLRSRAAWGDAVTGSAEQAGGLTVGGRAPAVARAGERAGRIERHRQQQVAAA